MRTKRFIFSIIALAIAMTAGAQNEMSTAILQSGETVTMFTGINALIDAHTAAKDGDVITLSAGKFNGTTISKSVSIYGAGFETDASLGTDITEVYGLTIGKEGSTLSGVHVEGLFINGGFNVGGTNATAPLVGLQVVKVKFTNYVYFYSDMTNALFDQCIFLNYMRGYPDANDVKGTITFNNCYFASDIYYLQEGCFVKLDHCIYAGQYYSCKSSNISNTILFGSPATGISPQYYNIVATFDNYWNCATWYKVSKDLIFSDVVDNYSTYTQERTFEIKQPDVWKAPDGTEIGIRGGDGWSKAPSTPVLKELSTRVDGATLQVEYQAVPR
ncbi:MAG: hypothetical protein IKZ93_03620 [Prevotella sp.]|nr:hypothetical protein [Prevotella sp.]